MAKKLLSIIILLLAVLPLVCADIDKEESARIYQSEYLTIDVDLGSQLEVSSSGVDFSSNYVHVDLYFFPREYSLQTVLALETEPEAEVFDDFLRFGFSSPDEGSYSYELDSLVDVQNEFVKVLRKTEFPVKQANLPEDVIPYLDTTEKIDSGRKEIYELADTLAKGEDDLYVVVHNFADWVERNIEYSLSTVTSDASQKASWVLENRQGVCDELTALFIAMCRSVGIPAKFVSGVSYTNSPLFEERWGAHGWAEVYFPGTGWIPFDVTYKEFGWIDASHVKLKDSFDPGESSTKFEWKGADMEVEVNPLRIEADIADFGPPVHDFVEIEAEALDEEIGIGSYGMIKANITNIKDYYTTTDAALSRTKSVEVIGENRKNILLRPGETKTVFWKIKVNESLDEDYIYTIPFIVYNVRQTNSTAEIRISDEATEYSEDYIDNRILSLEKEKEKDFEKDIEVKCIPSKGEYYVYEENNIRCAVQNKGNILLRDLNVCLSGKCERFDIPIAQKVEVDFPVEEIEGLREGVKGLIIDVENDDVSESEYVELTVLDRPKIEVADLDYPSALRYDEKGRISFVLRRASFSNPYEVDIKLVKGGTKEHWRMDELKTSQPFEVDFVGKELAGKINDFDIRITYLDKNKKEYEETQSFTIELVELNLMQKIMLFFRGLGEIFS